MWKSWKSEHGFSSRDPDLSGKRVPVDNGACSARTGTNGHLHRSLSLCAPSSEDREQVAQKLSLFRREFAEKILIQLVHLTVKRCLKVASASSECHLIYSAVGRMRLALDQSRMLQAIKQPGH